MRREPATPRTDWPARLEAIGFDFHTDGEQAYWCESACYVFTGEEIDRLETATNALHEVCLEAVDRLVTAGDLGRVGIPAPYRDWVAASWRRRDPSLYGRFDLTFDTDGTPKLLEYNADTPTCLVEAAVAQWLWLEDTRPDDDQFNSIHDKLIEAWRAMAGRIGRAAPIHFTGMLDEPEDFATLQYLRDVCQQAGFATECLPIESVGWNGHHFTDLAERPIRILFKLYPWEWLFAEDFASHLPASDLLFLEPPWKAILSNKAILAILWELFPEHPNLLPASFRRADFSGVCVEKTIHGREGLGVRIISAESDAPPDRIWQSYCPLSRFAGRAAVIGSWVVGDEAAGLGLRDDEREITGNMSQFLPHYFARPR
jgi:glutathionylspermidine synthase